MQVRDGCAAEQPRSRTQRGSSLFQSSLPQPIQRAANIVTVLHWYHGSVEKIAVSRQSPGRRRPDCPGPDCPCPDCPDPYCPDLGRRHEQLFSFSCSCSLSLFLRVCVCVCVCVVEFRASCDFFVCVCELWLNPGAQTLRRTGQASGAAEHRIVFSGNEALSETRWQTPSGSTPSRQGCRPTGSAHLEILVSAWRPDSSAYPRYARPPATASVRNVFLGTAGAFAATTHS